MADRARRRPDAEIPDIGNGLVERVQDAVLAESGAERSLWNGDLRYTDPAKKVRGSASAEGRVSLSRKLVVEPLQELYATRAQPATRYERAQRRNALKTVAHELDHLAGPADHDHADRLEGMQKTEYKPIEEGVTEAWSQRHLDRIADRVLPPDLAEQVKSVRARWSYPGWAPAASKFADQIGAETGVSGDEVLSRMAAQPRTTKAQAAADLLFDQSDLPNLVPTEAERQAIRAEIRRQIDEGFAALAPLNKDTSINRPVVSAQRGQEIADSAIDVVHAAENRYREARDRELAQQAARTTEAAQSTEASQEGGVSAEDLSALPPPNPAERIEHTPQDPRVAFAQDVPTQSARPSQPVDPRVAFAQPGEGARPVDPRVAFAQESPAEQAARLQRAENTPTAPSQGTQQDHPGQRDTGGPRPDQDVAALRAVLSPQPSAAEATRLPQGQAVQGTRSAQPSIERPARSTETPAR